ncbi:MAG: phosphoribosylaminoimidazolesuccinocarboxamide synthase [Clostridiales bacterium]|jgi:phosphoribosylaminoimidazole-succinocarboxamide synthase|nr:phosphoribosylaminoimidazolesuccinocarboxamide synthase [Clostridiales bacterium]MBR6209997.1 phosphoribosylaminoimidazolesuccinocarboxamide synthase [Clostridiales bacterium]
MLIKDTSFIDKPVLAQGKVRSIYDTGDSLLMIVTDRISAFDVIFDELIPDKGRVLSSISAFWFDFTKDIIPNHVITTDVSKYPEGFAQYKEELEGRSMLVKKAEMLPAECIVRGYLEGSALKEYKKSGTVGGIKMPEGLLQGDKLPEPLFTPSTKEESGHDINITYEQLVDLIGEEDAKALRDASLALYTKVSEFALTKGLILADTKFEFGKIDGVLTVCDEMFTPDSSRFWDLADYQPGRAQKSFDKQFLREWLETLDWDKTYPAPTLPQEIIDKTAEKYRECYTRITGKEI